MLTLKTKRLSFFYVQARERYLNWQKSSWFAPTNLKGYRDLNILPVFLPYWVFSVQAKILYNASILQTDRKRSEGVWQEVGWRTLALRDYNNQDKDMQVLLILKSMNANRCFYQFWLSMLSVTFAKFWGLFTGLCFL